MISKKIKNRENPGIIKNYKTSIPKSDISFD